MRGAAIALPLGAAKLPLWAPATSGEDRLGTLMFVVHGDGRECTGHLQCPFSGSYVVRRLYVAPLDSDACTCGLCLRAWSEERESGRYRGETADASVLLHRAD